MKITIACKGHTSIPVDELTEFQGNLKELSNVNAERLMKQIIEHGFSAPLFVWKHAGKNYILDGHQRLTVVRKMIKDGWECPELPCDIIEAKTKKEAKEKLLSYISQFGSVSDQGLFDFVGLDLTFDELAEYKFPDFNLDNFKNNFFDKDVEDKEDKKEKIDKFLITIECRDEEEQQELFREFEQREIKVKYL